MIEQICVSADVYMPPPPPDISEPLWTVTISSSYVAKNNVCFSKTFTFTIAHVEYDQIGWWSHVAQQLFLQFFELYYIDLY